MPTTINLPGNGVQLGRDQVASIVYSAYASVTDQSVEVPITSAQYLVGEFFSGKNATGVDQGRVTIGVNVSLLTWSGKANLVEMLQWVFPPPGTDA
jgi:hypothetical protein